MEGPLLPLKTTDKQILTDGDTRSCLFLNAQFCMKDIFVFCSFILSWLVTHVLLAHSCEAEKRMTQLVLLMTLGLMRISRLM